MKNQKQLLFEEYLEGKLAGNQKKLAEEFYTIESQRITEWDPLLMGNKEEVKSRIKPHLVSKLPKRHKPLVNVAAVLLLMLAISYIFHASLIHSPSLEMVHKTTAYGQTSTIQLEDGTLIYLNAGSTLSYPKSFSPDSRHVQLVGEAFFEVHPDSTRPFIVSTPILYTTVLGTSFNVSAYQEEPTTVTVSTGKVLIQKTGSNQEKQQGNEVILLPNEQVFLTETTAPLVKSIVDASKFSSWINGQYYLDQMNMGTLTGVLERKFGVRFIFHDPQLKDCQLSGMVKKQSLRELMELLATTLGIEYKIKGKKVYLYGHHC
ncbi:FecR domain-containing protein [Echinicola sp. CAU 1574]|uniref:FecR domain-containing protein n=1 Tax=Echinicola arenosa TaxID=2774144 RepID=A0ABR9AK28_9BACT|nr:FecR domain-containing protein [Echinicola arenosa]MBD8489164.1 FecR domain-containing protein [Echinicola arenosa]